MELREWAVRILSADTLDEKLFVPSLLTDENPGEVLLWKEPTRPKGMEFTSHRGKSDKLPPFHEHGDPDKIATCLHRFAGHELLAVEIMAYALLAFPNAPKGFRKGVAHTLKEEQGHVRLYISRMNELGISLGDCPLYRHFWRHTPYLTTPLHYLSAMSLTFEMANLDFAPHYGMSFKRNGDQLSYELMCQITKDEMRHVNFGISWLRNLKDKTDDSSDWQIYLKNLNPYLPPKRGKGHIYHLENRRAAGVPEEWIKELKNC